MSGWSPLNTRKPLSFLIFTAALSQIIRRRIRKTSPRITCKEEEEEEDKDFSISFFLNSSSRGLILFRSSIVTTEQGWARLS